MKAPVCVRPSLMLGVADQFCMVPTWSHLSRVLPSEGQKLSTGI